MESAPLVVISDGLMQEEVQKCTSQGIESLMCDPQKKVDGHHLFSAYLPYLHHLIKFSQVHKRITTISII